MAVYDLCIVGAGMIGSSAARHAASTPGYKVCLIGPDEPRERKYRENGIYGAYYDEGRISRTTATDPIWAEMGRRSIQRYRKLEEDTGIRFYLEQGCLTVGPTGADFLDKTCATIQQQGAKATVLPPSEARKRFPYAHFDDCISAVYEGSEAGYINPRMMVAAEQTAAHLQGCDIIKAIVDEVRPKVSPADGGGKIYEVVTDVAGTMYAKKVLIATGASFGFRNLLPPGVQPEAELVTQSVILAEVPAQELETFRNMPCMLYHMSSPSNVSEETSRFHCYILPPIKYPNGKCYIKLGHGDEYETRLHTESEVREWYNAQPAKHIQKGLRRMLALVFPDFTPKSLTYDTCVTVVTQGRRPFIDLVEPTLAVALGGNGYAAKCCDEFGKLAADLVRNGGWTSDLPQENFRLRLKANM